MSYSPTMEGVETNQVKPKVFKIIVIGDSGVGKTSITYRFCSSAFPKTCEATIGVDFRERTLCIDNELIKLQIWDTAGQERFRKSMVQHYYRNAHAVVFVYDVTSTNSFASLASWIKECEDSVLDPAAIKIIVGNKLDKGDPMVPTAIAQQFADQYNLPLFETSAKDDSVANHVESIFLTLAHKLAKSRPMIPTPNKWEPRPLIIRSSKQQHIAHQDANNESDSCCWSS
ncbi:putative Ras-related protein Rab-33 isoform X2 [Artemia franciscana]|uniref:Ras-related protein Rab-33B n=1 Tax=Artemia franciscana TaxID=6661 RepID=A0AA88L6B1_ARTSF|nr:hypothetical protein QYM36_004109 [Artemia franciscana]